MHRNVTVAALTAILLLSPCANAPILAASADPLDVASDQPFLDWFVALTKQSAADQNYHRIPLDTKQSQEFVYLLHEAYRKQVTHDQFAEMVNLRYPDHQYEVNFILKLLPR